MTLATLRPDGWPQATTVGYANDGLRLYFLCSPDSQKAENLALDDRVSLTIDQDTPQVMDITGLSMAAHAHAVVAPAEGKKALFGHTDLVTC
jgi:nitroimidazol reductase NimA-like FMN-containing flavoprotein (pyridoxamine 5'-phosphate oxidase superfamily)